MKNSELWVKDLLYFLIGSDRFRSDFGRDIHQVIGGAPPDKVVDVLVRSQLVGQFVHLGLLPCLEDEYSSELSKVHRCQSFVERHIENEIRAIADSCSKRGVKIALLKGCGLWGEVYFDRGVRSVRDIDIHVLLQSDMDIFISLLTDLGYRCDDEDLPAIRYELGEFKRYTEIGVSEFEDFVTQNASLKYYAPYFRPGETGDKVISEFVVEPHFAPFVFTNGEYPKVCSTYLKRSLRFSDLYVYTRSAALPYLSAKICLDMEELIRGAVVKEKAFKLILDFVKLVESSSQQELKEACKIANQWKASKFLSNIFHVCEFLMPEIKLFNRSGAGLSEDILEKVMERIIRERAEYSNE